jgi:hypothetical protein
LKNFRSFKEEAVLSMVASTDKTLLNENTAPTGVTSLPRAATSAVIYGPNASGKTNLLRGLWMMRGMILESSIIPAGQPYNIQPFRLCKATVEAPSLFEATISLDGVRYQYGFEATPTRIVAEWLLVYQSAKPQVWFDRRYNEMSGEDEFKFGTGLKGNKRVWQEATRPNALFLSVAVQLNSESLTPLSRWFGEDLVVFLDGAQIPDTFSTQRVQDPVWENRIRTFLSSADIAISDIAVQKLDGFSTTFNIDAGTGGATEPRTERNEVLRPRFTHTAGDVAAVMEYEDESQGTQKLFALAGPLFDIIQSGKVLVVDELDRSLHALLVRHFIQVFNDPQINKSGAQLIFSTHDTSQLDAGILRRDQVWFTDKAADQSSSLTPLLEFSPRKDEALERGYLRGRYGGVPILPNRLIEKVDLGAG